MLKQKTMKKSGLLITGIILFIFSIGVNAQTKTGYDFFTGKWNIVVMSAPQGDVKMVVNFEKINEVLSASLKDSTGNDIYKVIKTEIDNDQAIITFSGSQGDVDLKLIKKDETNIIGDIMGMFTVEGKRFIKNN
jgi:hypothetical protein